jgi:RimJ/RimL family protein N-acetyltransferase
MESIRLEPLNESHLAAVAAMLADPDVLRFTRVPDPTPPDFAREWLQLYEAGRENGTREGFAAVGGDGRFLGVALAFDIDRAEGELELGYIVSSEARGRGAGTAILRALTDWAFAEAGAARIRLVIDVENPASLRVAERSGYVREGVLRSMYVKQGIREDLEIWSRLPSDPPPR